MGNCFCRRKNMVHPSETHDSSHGPRVPSHSPCALQIKVRITAREFKELLSQANCRNGNGGEFGRLIVEECLRNRYHIRVVNGNETAVDQRKVGNLETISEEE